MNAIDRLTEMREDHDLKQKDIALILGVQQSAVSKYEKGKAQYKLEDLAKLCLLYHVSADYILGLPEGLPYPKR